LNSYSTLFSAIRKPKWETCILKELRASAHYIGGLHPLAELSLGLYSHLCEDFFGDAEAVDARRNAAVDRHLQ
jgi:hypothetical protein